MPYSADLNPFEHVWLPLKEGVHRVCPDIGAITGGPIRIAKILGNAYKDSWDTFEDEIFESLIARMPDRVV